MTGGYGVRLFAVAAACCGGCGTNGGGQYTLRAGGSICGSVASVEGEGEGEGILYYLTWLRMTRVLSALTIRSS